MDEFYNGNKLLSLRDINGDLPELLICCGNRTAGKTFFFKRWMVRRFLKHGERFVVFVRFIDDIPNVADGFWADVGPIAFPGMTMTQKPLIHGKASELIIDDERAGYVIALNDPERIKRNSALFADAQRGFLDEFMSETGKYVPNEIQKFNSIRLSIARGGAAGTHARYFPVYLCSNNVTVFNPYFEEYGISDRINNHCKYMRGDGWVLEQTFNKAAAEAIRKNFRTMSEKEMNYATRNEYLLDDGRFVEKRGGMKVCLAIIRRGDKCWGVWTPINASEVYISKTYDPSCDLVMAFEETDHGRGTTLIPRSHPAFRYLRKMYEDGMVWFENGAARHAFIQSIAYAQ